MGAFLNCRSLTQASHTRHYLSQSRRHQVHYTHRRYTGRCLKFHLHPYSISVARHLVDKARGQQETRRVRLQAEARRVLMLPV